MQDNLLPCPFCGGDELSHGWDQPGWDGSEMTGNVECHKCRAFILADTESAAITAWNTRTTRPAVSEDDAELLRQLGEGIFGAAPDKTNSYFNAVMHQAKTRIEALSREKDDARKILEEAQFLLMNPHEQFQRCVASCVAAIRNLIGEKS